MKHRVGSVAAWEELREFDVVTGTTSCLSPALEGVAAAPVDLFDLLVVDEAHHAAAQTWAELLHGFQGTRAALLTATPFRRDRQGLPGRIAYTYPISMAIDEGVYQPIDFVPKPGRSSVRATRAEKNRFTPRRCGMIASAASSVVGTLPSSATRQ